MKMGIQNDELDGLISSQPDGSKKIETGIGAFGLKEGITPDELDQGLALMVASFYKNGDYKPMIKQPLLGFYENQQIRFEFIGKSKISEEELVTHIKTNLDPQFSPPKRYRLDVSFITAKKDDRIGWQLLDQLKKAVCEFAEKYTTFMGYLGRSE